MQEHGAFQSTLPVRGATFQEVFSSDSLDISIHAPRTGSDSRLDLVASMHRDFNPRSPYGERRFPLWFHRRSRLFQSTLPVRGATSKRYPFSVETKISIHAPRTGSDGGGGHCVPWPFISIHAPRTGSDSPSPLGITSSKAFQSTLPVRGATSAPPSTPQKPPHFNPRSPYGERLPRQIDGFAASIFQSTLPVRGATQSYWTVHGPIGISIHAPRTGSDPGRYRWFPFRQHFNPRSPYGERPDHNARENKPQEFQSTLPVRGATSGPLKITTILGFQSTLPVRGATPLGPRHCLRPQISIHAPRTGSDRFCADTRPEFMNFNPRSPYGERLWSSGSYGGADSISIHAPRTGSDLPDSCFLHFHRDFNPRSPYGERRSPRAL